MASGQSVSINRHGPSAVKLPLKTQVYWPTCLFVEAKKRGFTMIQFVTLLRTSSARIREVR